MITNALPPAYTEYKLYRSSEWDNYDFKGRLPSGKWQNIYSNFVAPEISDYSREMILINYQVDITTIPHITKGA